MHTTNTFAFEFAWAIASAIRKALMAALQPIKLRLALAVFGDKGKLLIMSISIPGAYMPVQLTVIRWVISLY